MCVAVVTFLELNMQDSKPCLAQVMKSTVAVPQSIPGLVTKGILVMTFLEGEQITRLKVESTLLHLFQLSSVACFADCICLL